MEYIDINDIESLDRITNELGGWHHYCEDEYCDDCEHICPTCNLKRYNHICAQLNGYLIVDGIGVVKCEVIQGWNWN